MVCLNSFHSSYFLVISSVPQATKLGPLKCILFANDLVKLFKFALVQMYADDVSIYAVIDSDNDRIAFQNELNELCVWASMWGLKINLINIKFCILVVIILTLNTNLRVTLFCNQIVQKY